jgi:uncharacterized membrane protein
MELLKKMRMIGLVVCLMTFSFGIQAQDNAKARALGSMAMYGTIGGTLLGTASLAFGTSARAIAQGASIGLYLGLIFGSYVVLSHSFQNDWSEDDYGFKNSLSSERLMSTFHPQRDSKKQLGEWKVFVPILAFNY